MTKSMHFQKIPLSEVDSPYVVPDLQLAPVVLVVDDEPLVANTLVAILSKKGYFATAAYGAEEALASAKLIPPDFLITDILMPGMDGIDLAAAVKHQVPDCKVLLFSGHAAASLIADDPRCVRYDFPLLAKPVHPDALLACIAGLSVAAA